MNRFAKLLLVLALSSFAAVAQVDTGVPTHATFGGGSTDVINLGNLNIHVDIPLINKPGRAMPFTYDLVFDNAVWEKITPSGAPRPMWSPVQGFGWLGKTQVKTGVIYYDQHDEVCYDIDGLPHTYTVNDYTAYVDPVGFAHGIGQSTYTVPSQCDGSSQTTFSVSPTDGSGLTITESSVKTRDGITFHPPANLGSAGDAIDNNGNTISNNGSGTWIDTIGSNALVISGTTTVNYTYVDASGTPRSVKVNYGTHQLATNFGCSGIDDYTPLQCRSLTVLSFLTAAAAPLIRIPSCMKTPPRE